MTEKQQELHEKQQKIAKSNNSIRKVLPY